MPKFEHISACDKNNVAYLYFDIYIHKYESMKEKYAKIVAWKIKCFIKIEGGGGVKNCFERKRIYYEKKIYFFVQILNYRHNSERCRAIVY